MVTWRGGALASQMPLGTSRSIGNLLDAMPERRASTCRQTGIGTS